MKKSHDIPCFDHEGNIYDNIKSMRSFWHIRPETFTRRMNVYGMTLEDALTRPVKPNGGLQCTDHCGEKFFLKVGRFTRFLSFGKMCRLHESSYAKMQNDLFLRHKKCMMQV